MEKKPTIEFIKWIIEKAEGFEYQEYEELRFPVIKTPDLEVWNAKTIKEFSTRWGILLTRAIEGIEKSLTESGKLPYHDIEIQYIFAKTGKWYWRFDNPKPNGPYNTPDQAKEAALMYVKGQEETND